MFLQNMQGRIPADPLRSSPALNASISPNINDIWSFSRWGPSSRSTGKPCWRFSLSIELITAYFTVALTPPWNFIIPMLDKTDWVPHSITPQATKFQYAEVPQRDFLCSVHLEPSSRESDRENERNPFGFVSRREILELLQLKGLGPVKNTSAIQKSHARQWHSYKSNMCCAIIRARSTPLLISWNRKFRPSSTWVTSFSTAFWGETVEEIMEPLQDAKNNCKYRAGRISQPSELFRSWLTSWDMQAEIC